MFLGFVRGSFSRGAFATPLHPALSEEVTKAERRAANALIADRVLRPQTRSRREQLLEFFEKWLIEQQRMTLPQLLDQREVDAEYVSEIWVEYGEQVYYLGSLMAGTAKP